MASPVDIICFKVLLNVMQLEFSRSFPTSQGGLQKYQNNKVNSLNSSINVRVMKNPQNLGRREYDSHYPAKAQA